MRKNNEIQVIDKNNHGMRMRKGDKTVEVSSEICQEMATLGTQLISGVGGITVEYFKVQAEIYYAELNTYITERRINSEERRILLQQIEKMLDKYSDLINETDDLEKIEQFKSTYKFFVDTHSKIYMNSLNADLIKTVPKRENPLSGLISMFRHDKK